jgi:predicted  nucleic acid-binding Zn-ribbon protein
MTNEEMQRAMEFIVNQQAQITANIQKLQESQAKLQESQAKGGDRVTQLESLLARFAAATVKRFEYTDAKINALIEAQMRTDEAVRNLTAVVDRYFRERNGDNG